MQKWFDYQMVWKPQEYGKISTIRVPPDKVVRKEGIFL